MRKLSLGVDLLLFFVCRFLEIKLGNCDHETSSNRGRFERFTTYLSKADFDRLLNKAIQVPSVGGGCVLPIAVPY